MLFRPFIDPVSSTCTYLIASAPGREAVIIDPQVPQHLTAIQQLGLHLVKAIDTHIRADHVTALGELRDRTRRAAHLAGKTREQHVGVMNDLHLPCPKLMDVAIPANVACGLGAAT